MKFRRKMWGKEVLEIEGLERESREKILERESDKIKRKRVGKVRKEV